MKRFFTRYKHHIKNGTWIIINQIVTILIGILLSIAYARYFTKEEYGKFNLVLSIIAIASILSIPGFDNAIVRSVARGFDGVYKKAVRKSFLWSMLGIPLLMSVAGYFYILQNQTVALCLLIASIVFPFYYAPNSWKALLQGKAYFKYNTFYSSMQSLLNMVFTVFALVFYGRLVPVFAFYIGTYAGLNVLIHLFCLRFIKTDATDEFWEKSGYKLTVVPFVSYVYAHIDKIVIGLLIGSEDLAIYSIATVITARLVSEQRRMLALIQPSLYQKKSSDQMIRYAPAVFSISGIIAAGITIMLPFLMTILYGSKYADSIAYAQLYMICFPPASLNAFFSTVLIGMGGEDQIVKIRISMVVVNVLLYFTLIPLLGIIGAIYSSIVYYLLNALLMYISIKKYTVREHI